MGLNFEKLDRTKVWVGTMEEAERQDREFWWSRTPFERLQALEHLRQINNGYGEGQPTPRLQRVLKVAQLRRR